MISQRLAVHGHLFFPRSLPRTTLCFQKTSHPSRSYTRDLIQAIHPIIMSALESASISPESLEQEIAAQTAVFNELRLQSAAPVVLDNAKKRLGELKKALAVAKGGSKDKDTAAAKKKDRLLLKTAKVCFSRG